MHVDNFTLSAFWDKKFDVVKSLSHKDYIPTTKEHRIKYVTGLTLYALTRFIDRDTLGFLGVFKSDNFDTEALPDVSSFTSLYDINAYICVSLLTIPRSQALTYIKNQNFQELFKLSMDASKFIDHYIHLNYSDLVDLYRKFMDHFKFDPYLQGAKLSDLGNQVNEKLLK